MTAASIRTKNPGAMWGSSLAIKWGAASKAEMLNDGKGQGNNIAVFKTYVDGICAQLDLWRTGKYYKDKPFAVGIATWAGGNSVPSYIKLVKSRIPGMDGDTIINDAFLRGPNCIPFLKAQAFHEAGMEYPAPEADWIEAKRRVFAGITPVKATTAAPNVQLPTAEVDEKLKSYQKALIGFGYFEVGEADGRIGARTLGQIKAFFTDRKLDAKVEYPSRALDIEIMQARAEKDASGKPWHRPIAPARAFATETDIAPKVASVAPTQRAGLFQTITAWLSGTGAVVGTAVKFLPDANDQVSPYSAMVQQWFPSTPTVLIFAAVAAVAVATAIQISKAKKATVDAYNVGKIN